MNETPLQPFLRTKYSKKLLATEVAEHFSFRHGRFVDATFTDGAVLAVQGRSPKRTVINTTDTDVALLLGTLRDELDRTLSEVEFLWEDLSREEYESVSAADLPGDPAEAAAQLLYINQLSQPGTTKYDPSHRADKLSWTLVADWAARLSDMRILQEEPFERLDQARPTDLVFLDTSAGVDLAPALNVAAESPGCVAILAPGDEDPGAVPAGLSRIELTRCRPGARIPDALYLKSE